MLVFTIIGIIAIVVVAVRFAITCLCLLPNETLDKEGLIRHTSAYINHVDGLVLIPSISIQKDKNFITISMGWIYFYYYVTYSLVSDDQWDEIDGVLYRQK